jgi:hypothetical protein
MPLATSVYCEGVRLLVVAGAGVHGARELVGHGLHHQRDPGFVLGEGWRGGEGAQQRQGGGALQGTAGELHVVCVSGCRLMSLDAEGAGLCRGSDISRRKRLRKRLPVGAYPEV